MLHVKLAVFRGFSNVGALTGTSFRINTSAGKPCVNRLLIMNETQEQNRKHKPKDTFLSFSCAYPYLARFSSVYIR